MVKKFKAKLARFHWTIVELSVRLLDTQNKTAPELVFPE